MKNAPKNNDQPETAAKKKPRKKAYQSPHLDVYGNLQQLTRGGGGPKNEPGGPATPNTKA